MNKTSIQPFSQALIDQKKAEFIQRMDSARRSVKNLKYLEKKWLRDSEDLFKWYFRELNYFNPKQDGSVYDIGAGPGYLMWFCKEFRGCSIAGNDSSIREDYHCAWDALDLNGLIQQQYIKPETPLNLTQNYDSICATGICFDRLGSAEKLWSLDQYLWFIADTVQYLKPNGELYLRFNVFPIPEIAEKFAEFGWHESGSRYRIRKTMAL